MPSRVNIRVRARLLIVDDDASTRLGIARLLAAKGYAVDTAHDGAAALALAAARPPDVVLTDLMMPGLDGIALMQKLHELDPYLPVIVATAAWDLVSAVRAMGAGAHDYLAKPVDVDSLAVMIERALERRKNRIVSATLLKMV